VTTGDPIYLVSACASGEEFVVAFRRYTDRNGLFIPIAEPIPVGRRGRFALTLKDGGVMVEGDGEVISSSPTPSALHGRVGMTIRFADLDAQSKTVLVELEKARLVMKPPAPSVSPRPAVIPAEPRAVPPAAAGRIDTNNARAQCVAIGDLAKLASADPKSPPRAGPKFVVPSIPPVAGQRPRSASTPPFPAPRTQTPSTPPPIPPLRTPPIGMPAVSRTDALHIPPPAISRADTIRTPPREHLETIPARPPDDRREPTRTPSPHDAREPLPGALSTTMIAVKPVADSPAAAASPGAFSETMPAITLAELTASAPPPAMPRPAAPTNGANDEAGLQPTTPTQMSAVPPPGATAQIMQAVTVSMTPTSISSVPPPAPSAQFMQAVTLTTTPTQMDAVPPPPPTDQAIEATQTDRGDRTTPSPRATQTMPMPPMASPVPAPPIVAQAQPSIASIVDLEEPTDLNVIPQILDELPVRRTALGVAVRPAAELAVAASQATASLGPQASVPRVEEPTPSGDWTITPGATGPTITPRTKKEPTGDYVISLDSSRPDGWSEPSKLDIPVYKDPPAAPAPAPAPKPKPAPAPTRSIVVSREPPRPLIDEPKVQVDPTLIEPLASMPFETEDASESSGVPLAASASGMRMLDTPVATASDLPSIAPKAIGLTPMPGSIGNATSPTAAYEGMQMAALGLQPRAVPDGGGAFFHESRAVEQHSEATSMVVVGRRRRRLIVIIASAAVAAVAGVVVVIVLGNQQSEETVPPADAAQGSDHRTVGSNGSGSAIAAATVVDAAVEAPPPVVVDAAVAAECFVDITSVPAGAEIVQDKDVIGTSPAKLTLPCDAEVKLVVRKPRFASATRTVMPTVEGATLKVTLAAARAMYSVKVSTQPAGASITVNGKPQGFTPSALKLPAFELSTITLMKDGFATEKQKVTPKQNSQTVHVVLKKKR
jgi:hypothetical protein